MALGMCAGGGAAMAETKQNRRIFLSSVTGEFGEHRRMLKADLSLPRVKVQEQGELVQGEGKLLQTLDKYIREDCDAVIHLFGSEVGQPLRRAADESLPVRRALLPVSTRTGRSAHPTIHKIRHHAAL